MNYFKQFGLPNPHRPGSRFWFSLPHEIPEHYLFNYLSNIEMFIHIFPGGTMYLYDKIIWFHQLG